MTRRERDELSALIEVCDRQTTGGDAASIVERVRGWLENQVIHQVSIEQVNVPAEVYVETLRKEFLAACDKIYWQFQFDGHWWEIYKLSMKSDGSFIAMAWRPTGEEM